MNIFHLFGAIVGSLLYLHFSGVLEGKIPTPKEGLIAVLKTWITVVFLMVGVIVLMLTFGIKPPHN